MVSLQPPFLETPYPRKGVLPAPGPTLPEGKQPLGRLGLRGCESRGLSLGLLPCRKLTLWKIDDLAIENGMFRRVCEFIGVVIRGSSTSHVQFLFS